MGRSRAGTLRRMAWGQGRRGEQGQKAEAGPLRRSAGKAGPAPGVGGEGRAARGCCSPTRTGTGDSSDPAVGTEICGQTGTGTREGCDQTAGTRGWCSPTRTGGCLPQRLSLLHTTWFPQGQTSSQEQARGWGWLRPSSRDWRLLRSNQNRRLLALMPESLLDTTRSP